MTAAERPLDGVDPASPLGSIVAVQWQGNAFAAIRSDDGWVLVADRCPHAASMLSPGRIRRGHIMCPLHGAMFSLSTGACAGGGYRDLKRFDVRVEDGQVAVAIPTEAPGMEDIAIKAA